MYLCIICGSFSSGKSTLINSLLDFGAAQSDDVLDMEVQTETQASWSETLEKALCSLRETAIRKEMEERQRERKEQIQQRHNALKSILEVLETAMEDFEQEAERIRLELKECIDARMKDYLRNKLLNELSRILCHGYAEHQLGMKLSAYVGKSQERLDNRERIQCAQNPRSFSGMLEFQRRFPRILENPRRFIPPDLFQRYIRLCIRSVSNYGILGTAS